MGTTLRDAVDLVGGLASERDVLAIVPGVSNKVLPPSFLDVPLTFEAMAEAGAGLGSAGFVLLDDTHDVVAAVAGVVRFLAVESCGQCTPCKDDGLALSDLLERLAASDAPADIHTQLGSKAATVADGARCNLARQTQAVVQGMLADFPDAVQAHLDSAVDAVEPMVVAELVDLHDSVVEVDLGHADKQPDWTYETVYRGGSPADLATSGASTSRR